MFPAERVLGPLNPLRWFRALRTIKRFSPDLIVIAWWHSWLFPWTSFSMAWLRWLQQQRLALLCHNIRSHDHPAADGLAWSVLSRLPHTHIVHSSADPDRIRAINPKAHVLCLPHPAYEMFSDPKITQEEARERLHLDPDAEVCLCFGLVRHYKGLDIAIEALGRLLDRPRLHLLVAGEFYEPKDPYDRQIQRLGLTGRATIHAQYIPNEDVAMYFRAADVLLAPYRAGSHSGVVQIARAMGLPVIASDAGGMGDLVADGETGLLVPARDPAALARAIERFFAQGLAERFRRHLAEEKDSFSWSQLAETVCRLASDSC
jgi:glycosyltransferase involved in cell wall biosynthesis